MRLRVIILCLLLGSNVTLSSQTQLTVSGTSSPSSAGDCISSFQLKDISLTSSMNCATDIVVLLDKGTNITGLGNPQDTIKVDPHTLTLDSVGIYSFVCDSKLIADQCFHVVAPPAVPTLGTWALIILTLMLNILGVLALGQKRNQSTR